MRKFFRSVHLYLSLVAGIFIIIACLTGSILVFEEEINHLIYSKRYFVEVKSQKIPIDELIKHVENPKTGLKVSAIKIYNQSDRSIELSVSKVNNNLKNKIKIKEPNQKRGDVFIAYVNPYNGKIIDLENKRKSFFKKVKMFHRFLLSRKGGVGHYIMSYASLFFFFILITGIILWWPKSKAILEQRLKIKWSGNRKRLIHDLHVVVGFYASVFLIVLVMTGLVMSFNWLNKGVFFLTHSSSQNPKPSKSLFNKGQKTVSINAIQEKLSIQIASSEEYLIRFPEDIADVFQVNILAPNTPQNQSDTYYLNQYTAEIIGRNTFLNKNLGQKIISFIKPIHTGKVYGLTTKIINFIIVLLTLTFPVSGMMMWLSRLKKKIQ